MPTTLKLRSEMSARGYRAQAFALAFHSRVQREGGCMNVLHGYFDESGTHADSDSIVLAGFLSTAHQWERFETDWNKALTEYELPFFHMTDFAVKAGVYADWTEHVRRARLAHLMRIIDNSTIRSYGVSLSKKIFEGAFSTSAQRFIDSPYSFASKCCFLLVASDLREMGSEVWATHVLEDGARGKGEVLAAYEALTEIPDGKASTRILSLRFEDKRNFVPLQAADILAYELYKEHPNQTGQRDSQQRMPFHLLFQMPHRWIYLGEQEIRTFAVVADLIAQRHPS